MNDNAMFNGIGEQEKARMLECFGITNRRYDAGETVLTYSRRLNHVCVLISGAAKLYWLDDDGNSALLENISRGEIFGEVFWLPVGQMEYCVQALEPCEVMFIDYRHIITPCANVCPHHCQIINNLYELTAKKMQKLALRINILTQKNTRRKLAAYLEHRKSLTGASAFRIPMTLTSLAEYLNIDRSSMMRELASMKSEGLLDWSGRDFVLDDKIKILI